MRMRDMYRKRPEDAVVGWSGDMLVHQVDLKVFVGLSGWCIFSPLSTSPRTSSTAVIHSFATSEESFRFWW